MDNFPISETTNQDSSLDWTHHFHWWNRGWDHNTRQDAARWSWAKPLRSPFEVNLGDDSLRGTLGNFGGKLWWIWSHKIFMVEFMVDSTWSLRWCWCDVYVVFMWCLCDVDVMFMWCLCDVYDFNVMFMWISWWNFNLLSPDWPFKPSVFFLIRRKTNRNTGLSLRMWI